MMQKTLKMTETLANGYSYESTQRELSNEYQHDRVSMVFKNLCILVLRMKVSPALEGLRRFAIKGATFPLFQYRSDHTNWVQIKGAHDLTPTTQQRSEILLVLPLRLLQLKQKMHQLQTIPAEEMYLLHNSITGPASEGGDIC